jgi:phosphoribosylglycinamide formyltransferase-1
MKTVILMASGEGTNFSAMVRSGVRIDLVITDKTDAGVIKRARDKEIECVCIVKKSDETKEDHERRIIAAFPTDRSVDLILLAGYMRMLTPFFLNQYPKVINVHPSLLPSFKGKNSIEDAYRFGCKYIGATIHWVNEEMDAGQIIEQEGFRVDDEATLTEVIKKMHLLENAMYPRVVHQLLTQVHIGGLEMLFDYEDVDGNHHVWKRAHV